MIRCSWFLYIIPTDASTKLRLFFITVSKINVLVNLNHVTNFVLASSQAKDYAKAPSIGALVFAHQVYYSDRLHYEKSSNQILTENVRGHVSRELWTKCTGDKTPVNSCLDFFRSSGSYGRRRRVARSSRESAAFLRQVTAVGPPSRARSTRNGVSRQRRRMEENKTYWWGCDVPTTRHASAGKAGRARTPSVGLQQWARWMTGD